MFFMCLKARSGSIVTPSHDMLFQKLHSGQEIEEVLQMADNCRSLVNLTSVVSVLWRGHLLVHIGTHAMHAIYHNKD